MPPSLLLSRRTRPFTPRSNSAFPFLLLIRKARKPVVRPGGSIPFLVLLRGHQHAPASVNPDLLAAIIAWLRTNNGGSVATAFGDTPSTPKFFPRPEFGKLPPYATFEEQQATREKSSGGNYIARGIILATIYSSSGQVEAKRLADLIEDSLNDPPLVWQSTRHERLMNLWVDDRSVVIPDTSVPLAPSLFQVPVVFSFMVSGQK